MEWTLLLKVVHVIAAIVAVGANLTYTFWIRYAGRDPERLTWAIAGIRRLDNRVATPAYVVVLISGVLMVAGGVFSFETAWIVVSIVLYVIVVLVALFLYSPALKRQLHEAELDAGSQSYHDAARLSNLYGLATLAVVLVIVTLMVTKPVW